jgi:hypothetical protein
MISKANNGTKVKVKNHELNNDKVTTENNGDAISPIGVSAKAKDKKAADVVSVEINNGTINILQDSTAALKVV